MRAIRLLIIEDVEDHALLVVRELQKGGFQVAFERVETREELQRALEDGAWDAVISDYNLPGFGAAEALGMVQQSGDLPFLLVSGAIGEETAAELIKGGAHAYIRKGNYARLAPTLEREITEAAIRRERRHDAEQLASYREHLEELVRERTVLLEEANEALRHNEERLKLAMEAASLCTWRFHEGSRERIWDDHCHDLLQIPRGERITHERYLSVVHPDDREPLDAGITEAFRGERPYAFEYRVVWPDGSEHWMMSRGEFSLGEAKTMTGVLLDITDRKRYEEAVEKARGAAEAAARAKSDFLANMTHEIRTPLNGILGVTDLVFDTDLSPMQVQYMQMIRNSAEILLSVVNDVLDFSKIEAGKLTLEEVEFDLRKTLENVVEMLALHAHKKGLEISLAIDSSLPDYFVGDPIRLRQVLINLTGNAVKFTDRGEVIVRLAGTPAEEGDRWDLTFSVTDTGIGIPQHKFELLFHSFTQVDPSMGRSAGGTGLGLAISKSLVEQMGGRIWVESTPGAGSTFSVRMQLPGSARQRELHPQETQILGLRTLVLDDNETNRQLLIHTLSEKGAVVDTAATGREAIAKVKAAAEGGAPYDLALLDHNLPDMDGFEVAEVLRSEFPIAKLGIMMLTSEDIDEGARRAREMGMVAYIVKPVRIDALVEAVLTVRSFHEGETAMVKDQPQPAPPPTLPFCTRVLVVEDNMVNLTVAEAMLRRSGAKVTAAVNGAEALQAVDAGIFDVILMDVQMPGIDGLKATRKIREKGIDVPVIGLTALALQGDRERCLESGMDDYLAKPFTADELIAKVATWSLARPRAAANLESMMKQVGGVCEIVDCVVKTFRENALVQLSEVRDAVEAFDPDRIEKGAHRLKGGLLVVGAEKARCLAEQLEEAGREKELEKTKALVEQLEGEVERVLKKLSQGSAECLSARAEAEELDA